MSKKFMYFNKKEEEKKTTDTKINEPGRIDSRLL